MVGRTRNKNDVFIDIVNGGNALKHLESSLSRLGDS
jgi:hypothetical protein